MKIYIVIIEDRYSDVGVLPFSDPQAAKDKARTIAREYASHKGDIEEVATEDLLCIRYSFGGDYVTVVECELDANGEAK